MNGTPRQITVSLGIQSVSPSSTSKHCTRGIRHALNIRSRPRGRRYHIVASGSCNIGDLHRRCPKDKIVYRNGAKDTDLICVSGDLGAAYMDCNFSNAKKSPRWVKKTSSRNLKARSTSIDQL
ncbi:hypothetical protein [Muribaculum gordoncarteri]|uniref:hypothetical protein n=1 Tax=Muribaculum gordoncarteri TaxID=2530390 RepID=UPI003F678FD2